MLVLPGQLPLRHRVGVLQATVAVDDQQAVVDAVEQRLQALLAVDQGLHVGLLELVQSLRHETEAPAQGRQLGDRRGRQGDVEITAADLVGSGGQPLDRLAETSREAVRGNEADQQHGYRGESQQARQQRGAITAAQLGVADLVVGRALHVGHQAADLVEGLAQRVVFQQGQVLMAAGFDLLQEGGIGAGDCTEGLAVDIVVGLGDAALQGLLEALAQRGERLAAVVVGKHHDQVIAQRLTQLLVDLDDAEVVADQLLLALGHLHHADQRQQQAQQGHRHQCREPEEKSGSQLHLQFHRPYCLRFLYRVEASMPRMRAACSRVSLVLSTPAMCAFSSASRLSGSPMRGALLPACSPSPR